VTRGRLPQRAGSLDLNGGGTAAAVPPPPGNEVGLFYDAPKPTRGTQMQHKFIACW